MRKSVIIIGAGIAGLSAGCYLQMNGYQTRIFEMASTPGGLCTSWKRKGYTIDGCVHWLVGSGPNSQLHAVWEELGVTQRHTFVNHDEYLRVEGLDGRSLVLYTDPTRLEQHMKQLAPEDSKVIDEFVQSLRKLKGFDMPVPRPRELQGPFDKAKGMLGYLPYLGVLNKWRKVTLSAFASRFTNPLLREAISATAFDIPDFPMFALLMPMAWVHAGAAGYPLGGSLEFAKTIEQRYVDLGGVVGYNARVAKILVENKRAVGVRLADGTEHTADIVVSAADGRTTIFDMLDGKFADDRVRGYYRDLNLFAPLVYVAFGVARSFEDVPSSVSGTHMQLEEPIKVAGKEIKWLSVYVYNFDPSLAPKGKSVVKVMITTEWEYWEKLHQEPERYRAEKQRIAGDVLARLDKRFPGLASQVEVQDVATPTTFERYTGNWKGSFEGWMVDAKTWGMQMRKTLPGLANFYMVGQWVEPGGGLPPAAMSGRNLAQILCRKDGRQFVATKP